MRRCQLVPRLLRPECHTVPVPISARLGVRADANRCQAAKMTSPQPASETTLSGPRNDLEPFCRHQPMFRKSPLKLGQLRIGFFHIADDGLPTIVDMDMFDADKLMTAITQPSKNLNLRRIRSEQTSRCRSERRNPPLCSKSAIQLGENCHGGRVRAGHLDRERCLNFVLWRCGLDHSEGGVMPNGERAAACSCNKEGLTKSLDVVPSALFSRCHQSLLSSADYRCRKTLAAPACFCSEYIQPDGIRDAADLPGF
jgi:hypothetical protein